MSEMNINEVLRHLPHRYPFLLIDKVTEYEKDHHLVAYKNVSANESWVTGHFPDYPVFPGVLVTEAMAQASAILAFRSQGTTPEGGTLYLLAGIDHARFKRRVAPGDRLVIRTDVVKMSRGIWKFAAEARVDDQVASTAEILIAAREGER